MHLTSPSLGKRVSLLADHFNIPSSANLHLLTKSTDRYDAEKQRLTV
ncbi:hypothetical protein SAMN05216167_12070 [Spirosoma endophyticum]|uniref:Uncharacterized protein n=1 Tax=Spirosoma endophyticum TaxID=662367 RepID=A0A1I2DVS9_9BACT|nr:hypothetical protein SAMN05216167_12070 [Spirosoma endophyticum]